MMERNLNQVICQKVQLDLINQFYMKITTLFSVMLPHCIDTCVWQNGRNNWTNKWALKLEKSKKAFIQDPKSKLNKKECLIHFWSTLKSWSEEILQDWLNWWLKSYTIWDMEWIRWVSMKYLIRSRIMTWSKKKRGPSLKLS